MTGDSGESIFHKRGVSMSVRRGLLVLVLMGSCSGLASARPIPSPRIERVDHPAEFERQVAGEVNAQTAGVVAGCNITCDIGATPEGEADCGAASNGGDGSDQVNGGCSFTPFSLFSNLACSQTFCGTVGAASGFRDNDWYKFTVTQRTAIRATFRVEFSGSLTLYSTDGTCNQFNAQLTVPAAPCTPTVLETCVEPGSYFLRYRPDIFSGLACGSEYNLLFECLPTDPNMVCRGACQNTDTCDCAEDTHQSACSAPNQQLLLNTRCCEAECRAPGEPYDKSGMELLSHVPVASFPSNSIEANDAWGFTSPLGRKYAILGLSSGTGFVDITDPRNPEIVADIPDQTSSWSDFKVLWPYAYNGNETGGGVQVIDLSQIDPPTRSVTLVGTLTQSGLDTTHTITLNTDSKFLYLNGSNLGAGELVAVSLANPAAPVIVGKINDGFYVHDSQVVTYPPDDPGPFAGREIAFCYSGGSGLRIYDVTNKAAMLLLSTMSYPTLEYTHQGWLTDDRQYVVFNDELEEASGFVTNTTVYVANVSNLQAPTLAATFTHPNGCWIDHDLIIKGNRVYQAQYSAGLRVLDISNPLVPVEVAYFDTHPEDNSLSFTGMWGSYTGYPSRLIVGSDIERGLFVLCDEPEKPVAGFFVDTAAAACDATITFDGSGSTHCTASGTIVAYDWDFDYDGVTFDVDAVGSVVQHAYPIAGAYDAALRVTDNSIPSHSDISVFEVRVGVNCFGDLAPDICGDCVEVCGPGNGECCEAHASEGCGVESCCQAVCAADPGCCGVGGGVWDNDCVQSAYLLCSAQCAPAAPTPDTNKPRFLSMTIPASAVATGTGSQTAIRVLPTDLQNPIPANPPCCPPPNFSGYEAATCNAPGEARGCIRWAGPPRWFLENSGIPAGLGFMASKLQCSPYYDDWSTLGLFHITGAEIVPSSTYEVRTVASVCKGTETTCTAKSPPIFISTRRSGDVTLPFNPPDPSAQPDALDVVAMVNKFRNLTSAISKTAGQVTPNVPMIELSLSALDIVSVVDNFRGFAYAYSGPCPCPSIVPCNATPCTGNAQCPGGRCVKTCVGGVNDGLECFDNLECRTCQGGSSDGTYCTSSTSCPGGTCPTGPVCSPSGFCRDRCGRCN